MVSMRISTGPFSFQTWGRAGRQAAPRCQPGQQGSCSQAAAPLTTDNFFTAPLRTVKGMPRLSRQSFLMTRSSAVRVHTPPCVTAFSLVWSTCIHLRSPPACFFSGAPPAATAGGRVLGSPRTRAKQRAARQPARVCALAASAPADMLLQQMGGAARHRVHAAAAPSDIAREQPRDDALLEPLDPEHCGRAASQLSAPQRRGVRSNLPPSGTAPSGLPNASRWRPRAVRLPEPPKHTPQPARSPVNFGGVRGLHDAPSRPA
jgi:hypothetical protein